MVTVIGNVEIKHPPNPDNSYFHFAKRLKQRYGVSITKETYTELCNSGSQRTIYRHRGTGRVIVVIPINGKQVLAVKDKRREKKLITALPKNSKYKRFINP